ncbi:MAG: DsbA family protein [Pseudomonadota bacterium]|jgi:2-hydroxychromene-2-carboxylate isomerase|nr:DsbA family protein [Pseudomonadota bacterium]
MSGKMIPLYIDLKSPYSYIAAHRALVLEEAGKVAFDWRPFELNIAGRANIDREAFLRRARYLYRDVRRFATPLGLTVKGPRRIYDSKLASIGLLIAKTAGVHQCYISECYRRFFGRDLEIDDLEAIEAILANCGVDTSDFAAYAVGQGQDALAASRSEAETLGVFAVPTFIIGQELFWGQDRMDLAMTMAGII